MTFPNTTCTIYVYLQIYIEDQWGAICPYFWDLKESVIACRQLGYNTAVGTHYYPIPANISTFVQHITCVGTELLVGACWHIIETTRCDEFIIADVPYPHDSVAGADCTNEVTTEEYSVRIVPFSENDIYEGYVEVS